MLWSYWLYIKKGVSYFVQKYIYKRITFFSFRRQRLFTFSSKVKKTDWECLMRGSVWITLKQPWKVLFSASKKIFRKFDQNNKIQTDSYKDRDKWSYSTQKPCLLLTTIYLQTLMDCFQMNVRHKSRNFIILGCIPRLPVRYASGQKLFF